MLIHNEDSTLTVCAQSELSADLRMVNGRKRQDDFLSGRGNWVPITVVVNVFVFFLLGQPGSGILCHVAEVGFLQRAQHFI